VLIIRLIKQLLLTKLREIMSDIEDMEEAKPSDDPSKDDYRGLMSKANKQPNKFKKRLDVARAKKLKQKV
jgi:hypothetical protein